MFLSWLISKVFVSSMSSALAAVFGDGPVEPVSSEALREPTAIRHRSDEGALMLTGVRAVLDENLSESDRRRLGRKVLSESRVRMVSGSFPDGGATLVTVNVPLRLADPLAEPRFISGVFSLDDTGRLATIVIAPKMQSQQFELASIGDTDGDAIDDLVLDVAGPDTSERRVVTWKDGLPVAQAPS